MHKNIFLFVAVAFHSLLFSQQYIGSIAMEGEHHHYSMNVEFKTYPKIYDDGKIIGRVIPKMFQNLGIWQRFCPDFIQAKPSPEKSALLDIGGFFGQEKSRDKIEAKNQILEYFGYNQKAFIYTPESGFHIVDCIFQSEKVEPIMMNKNGVMIGIFETVEEKDHIFVYDHGSSEVERRKRFLRRFLHYG